MNIEQGAIEQIKRIAKILGYEEVNPDPSDPSKWYVDPGHKLLDDALEDITWEAGDE